MYFRPALLLIALCAALPARAESLAPIGPQAPQAEPPSECRILEATGDRFCKYGHRWKLENARAPDYAVGDDFPIYDHSMLMDLRRYDLPPVDGPWRYYEDQRIIYKVSAKTGKVIEVLGRMRRR
ncbi:hypothetical protein CKO11_04490 [Rhodobacter sp. TJ_12]|uniref:hypothetical protein n=1 Tax=Rhodobacter sp. TJ_12 TaxID=2029399 RepID=UPI001CC176AF|nr:hypothetical protein [Rhodobacter sp. TJ_12]MBZ4021717.1 hypothetical protein [Rhodobacter sp. TJ_12]